MRLQTVLTTTAAVIGSLIATERVQAYESSPNQTYAGAYIGSSAAMPPVGIYMFDRVNTLQGNLAGPVTNIIGDRTGVQSVTAATGVLFVPGWTFLGANYDAVIVQSFQALTLGSPINSQVSGMFNTYIVPGELSWKWGDSGFYTKAGLGIFIPDGTITGVSGTGNVGAPYWTFVPQLTMSYFKDGWNLSTTVAAELNTANSITGYTTGTILHADFTATKKIDRWTLGPVAYYIGQVSDDETSAYYNFVNQNSNRYNRFAVGGLLGYDFGPVTLTGWAAKDIVANASGPGPVNGVPKGFFVNASLSYRLWAPDQDAGPSPKRPLLFK